MPASLKQPLFYQVAPVTSFFQGWVVALLFGLTVLCSNPLPLFGGDGAGAPAGENKDRIMRQAASIRALPRDVAAQGLPVVLRGVVTFKWPLGVDGGFVVHDETAGIYVTGERMDERTLGMIVDVVGVTGPGGYAPIVISTSVREVGPGELPPARPTSVLELLTGQFDCQRVEVHGVVQATSYSPEYGMLNIDLATETGNVSVHVMPARPDEGENLVDAEVIVRGVAFPIFNPRAELMGVRVRAGHLSDVTVIKHAPEDPFAVPVTQMKTLMPFSTGGISLHRRRVAGTVTITRTDGSFCLQDGNHAIRVKTRPSWLPRIGETVEVSGFIDTRNFFAGIHNARVRPCPSTRPPIVPKRVKPSMILEYDTALPAGQPDYDGILVTLRGQLKSFGEVGRDGRCLYLACEGVLVPVDLGTSSLMDFSELRLESELEVTGACMVSYSALRPVMNYSKAVAFRLLLRAPEDVVVVQKASWWTAHRLLWALGCSAGLLAVILLWNVQLQRRVERRTARLAVEMRARLTAESRVDERTRLAAELHDSLEQSLTGVALQLQAAELAPMNPPEEMRHHLSFAREMLDASREEMRRCVWDLRSQVLDQRDLLGAITEITRQMGGGARIEISTEGEPLSLCDMTAHALLRCTQEAISNAVKHGSATLIRVVISFTPERVGLRITDNGCGFDPATVPGAAEGHFGLQGISERITRLEGEVTVESRPGQGTQVEAWLPVTEDERGSS